MNSHLAIRLFRQLELLLLIINDLCNTRVAVTTIEPQQTTSWSLTMTSVHPSLMTFQLQIPSRDGVPATHSCNLGLFVFKFSLFCACHIIV